MTDAEPGSLRARSLFLSDIHLGTRACRAEALLSLLKEYDCENIFLIGDIIDFWAMSRGIYWPELHNTVVQKILKKARHDVRVYLIPGNHDEALRDYIGSAFGDRLRREGPDAKGRDSASNETETTNDEAARARANWCSE